MKKKIIQLRAVILLLFMTSYAAYGNTDVDYNHQLTDLLLQNQNTQAYQLAQQEDVKRCGNSHFDFCYGIAAMRTHHPEEAVFALARVVLEQPYNYTARLDLARAYFALKDYGDAQKNFEIVLQHANMQEKDIACCYLRKIQKYRERSRLKTFLVGAYNIGYDTNINALTTSSVVPAPVPNGVIALSEFQRQVSSYFNSQVLYGGFNYRPYPCSTFNVFGLLGGFGRENFKTSQFDYSLLDALAGFGVELNGIRFRFPVEVRQYNLRPPFRNMRILDVTGQAQKRVGIHTFRLGLTGENINSSMPQSRAPQNIIVPIVGGNLLIVQGYWRIQPTTIPMDIIATLTSANGKPKDPTGAYQFPNYWWAKLRWQWHGINHQMPFVVLQSVRSNYQGMSPTFHIKRHDNTYIGWAGWRFDLNRYWALQPSYVYSYNRSNVILNQYRKQLVQLGVIFKLES